MKDHGRCRTVQSRSRVSARRAYFVVVAASDDTGSFATAGVTAEAEAACTGIGAGAGAGSPASGTLPDAAIARGCNSNATSPVQPV
jgi:hypothetical protein